MTIVSNEIKIYSYTALFDTYSIDTVDIGNDSYFYFLLKYDFEKKETDNQIAMIKYPFGSFSFSETENTWKIDQINNEMTGAYCTCPNGITYPVSSMSSYNCDNLKCENGTPYTPKCNTVYGEWSYNEVSCGTGVKAGSNQKPIVITTLTGEDQYAKLVPKLTTINSPYYPSNIQYNYLGHIIYSTDSNMVSKAILNMNSFLIECKRSGANFTLVSYTHTKTYIITYLNQQNFEWKFNFVFGITWSGILLWCSVFLFISCVTNMSKIDKYFAINLTELIF